MLDKLTIGIDTSEIRDATAALHELADAAERALVALKQIGQIPIRVLRVGEMETMEIGIPFSVGLFDAWFPK